MVCPTGALWFGIGESCRDQFAILNKSRAGADLHYLSPREEVLVAAALADDPQRGHFAQSEYRNGTAIDRVFANDSDRFADQVAQEITVHHDLSWQRFYQVLKTFLCMYLETAKI
jgi:hypothetical protein